MEDSSSVLNNVQTLTGLIRWRAEQTPDAAALGYFEQDRRRTVSYQELYTRAAAVARFLAEKIPAPPTRSAILLPAGPLWPEVFFAAAWHRTAVPVDPQLPDEDMLHIIRDAGCATVFTNHEFLDTLVAARDTLHALRHIVICDSAPETELPEIPGIHLYSYHDLAAAYTRGLLPPDPESGELAAIIYTSGTTGRPHGVLLTHRNLIANVKSCLAAVHILPSDHFALILPLHHSFALTANLLVPIAAGVTVSFIRSLRTLVPDLQLIRPTILLAVPLILYKFKERTEHEIRRTRLGSLLDRLPGAARLIGRRLIRALGGNIRMIVVGGSACDPQILQWCRKHGVPVIEGYGLTEAGPVLTLNPPERPRIGSAGKALPGVELRIINPGPDGVGEIAARGENVSPGYHNDPEGTAQTFRDGWLYTGDLGYLDQDGYLFITGRSKHLIVTAEGKNIHPEEVENVLARSPYIEEVLVQAEMQYDRPRAECLLVTVVPRMEAIDALSEKRRRPLSEAEIYNLLQQEVKRLTGDLPPYKRPRRVRIRYEPFEKTSTGKIKRFLYPA